MHPNNDFCFTEADFLEAVSNMNTVSKYHKVRSNAWSKIHELVGKEIDMSNKKDGSIKWRVPNHIIVGSRVEGPYGPLGPNPNPLIKRRVRARVVGTVLKANAQHKWDVPFDHSILIFT